MLVFPQLATGAIAQLPSSRETRFRVRRNQSKDGKAFELADPDFEQRSWDLSFRDLSDGEWQAIEDLFLLTKGRAGVFTFLDPGANLLQWSEKLAQAPWAPFGVVIDDQADPFGGARASRLPASNTVSQSLAAPAGFRYAASAWLRSTAPGAVIRVTDGGGNIREQEAAADGQWRRYVVRYDAASSSETVTVAFAAGGAPLDIYGAQLEAQATASAYKRTTSRGGVYPNTRFDQDMLVDRATAPGRRESRIRLVWTPLQT
jgi:hypothetical protein